MRKLENVPQRKGPAPIRACCGRIASLRTGLVPHANPDHPRAERAAARGTQQNQDRSNGRTTAQSSTSEKAASRHTGAAMCVRTPPPRSGRQRRQLYSP